MAHEPTYLVHLDLASGRTGRSRRSDCDAAALAAMRERLAVALADGATSSGAPGVLLRASASGRALLATLLGRGECGGALPIVTLGVALTSRSGAGLWRSLTGGPHPAVAAHLQRPPAPWCAARAEVGIVRYADRLAELAPLERLIAWAWVGVMGGA